jgi:hypothetical protein
VKCVNYMDKNTYYLYKKHKVLHIHIYIWRTEKI